MLTAAKNVLMNISQGRKAMSEEELTRDKIEQIKDCARSAASTIRQNDALYCITVHELLKVIAFYENPIRDNFMIQRHNLALRQEAEELEFVNDVKRNAFNR